MRNLTVRQEKFILEYLKNPNATQAAIHAGYNRKTARSIGQENLTKPDIQKRIKERLAQIEADKIADATEVMQYLTAVMRGEKSEETVVVEGCGDGCSEARVMEKKVAAREQVKAAELLAKRYGLLTENVKLEGEGLVQIVDDLKANKTE